MFENVLNYSMVFTSILSGMVVKQEVEAVNDSELEKVEKR